jgi:two-component system, OmpR family, response regulator
MHILIVEDDRAIGKALLRGLDEAGHACALARDGAKGLALARSQQFQAIVLDLMLPDMPGLDVLRELRRQGVQTPVLILTSLGSVEERVAGLNAGADDYLVKPFEFAELLARLEAICRRSLPQPGARLTAGPLVLNLSARRATRDGKEIELTPTEFSLLEFLMRRQGLVATRKMLCEHLWDESWEGVTNVIEVHINRLRNKIDRGFTPPLIHTVRGRGYVLRVAEDE